MQTDLWEQLEKENGWAVGMIRMSHQQRAYSWFSYPHIWRDFIIMQDTLDMLCM